MTELETASSLWLTTRKAALLLLVIWLATTLLSLFMHRHDIALLNFSDPDDSMRLAQVRDFLAGQSWSDVSQHRANPPLGGPMHWSRLVDLPIAGFILLLHPLIGRHWAEVCTVLIVPALTLAALLAALYWAVRQLMGKVGALLCCALFATSPMVLIQCAAMRIDHHGWQIVMMALVLGGTLHANQRRGGLVAGFAMAIWLNISGEGFPVAVLIGGAMALRYAFDSKEWTRIEHYVWTLVIASVVLLLVTHGWKASFISYCDAVSPIYLVPLAVVPTLMTAGHMFFKPKTAASRLVSIGFAASIAATIFLVSSKQCLAGPFSTLDPQVYEFWYKAVLEGLPIWMQTKDMASLIIVPSLLGITGYVLTISHEPNGSRRRNLLTMLGLVAGATALSILVMRTSSVAHLLAVPGNAWLLMALCARARSLTSVVLRVPATAALVFISPLVSVAMTFLLLSNSGVKEAERAQTINPSEIIALNFVAPATLFAPIDISPDILLHTRNSIIGTGHHRNVQGMKLVISAFLAPPEQARTIVLGTSATYLLMALNTGETERYRKAAPDGLAGQLFAGKPPAWLIPAFIPGLKMLRLYRIERTGVPLETD